ncbi:uncharacterized protein LOC131349397 [Hemibagrus wyckioides]|nr:uncharacterized protein LOC131349397 [Hemibagrus wyckioides]XP_058241018.1 uncharacterized protein LOC131349397 [Hemibagrus wyckioides]XP_058241019.1 uncharacterized protein LOC131349397 [Hemibagrus wyckioides]XP_058241020.1 uncharacterized protein LOC131349397 [Hemibagrus wyckioides]XP_058241021.1 uncharacterized protein LOC131349397 [Hemibagrus wyckioides]XP_058241022.1 uncharacterized protein LOC131349397 [Hemibagrus wyckioides]
MSPPSPSPSRSPSLNSDWSTASTFSRRTFSPGVIQAYERCEFSHNSASSMWAPCPTSDQSEDEGSSFKRRMKLEQIPSPCLSFKSDQSMGEPLTFRNKNITPDIRRKLGQIPSPCLSFKSDQSMGAPLTFRNENITPYFRESPSSLDYWRYLICKDLLNEPMSISRGHTFCKTCNLSYWEKPTHEKHFSCPQCRKRFKTRPEKINISLDHMLKQAGFSPALPAQSYAGPGDMACDLCTRKRRRAVKWCLTCSVAYCEIHVRKHYTVEALQKHELTDVTGDPETRTCQLHHRALEAFCKTEQVFICLVCVMEEHKDHDTVLTKGGSHGAEAKLTANPHPTAIQQREMMHILKYIEELTTKVKSLERTESEFSHLSKRFFRGLQDAPVSDFTSEFVEVAALGRRMDLGMLYDCRSDSFSSDIFLWEKNLISFMKLSIPRPQTDVRILDGDSLQDRLTALDLSLPLRASVVSGLVEMTGASAFIDHPVQTELQDRVTVHYRTSTRLDMLSQELLQDRFLSVTGSTTATHVVVAVLYGSQAFFVFDSKKDSSTEKTDLKGMMTKMIASSSQIDLLSRLVEKEITASFVDGDVLQHSVGRALQNAGAVPLKVWLYPLKNLNQTSACVVKDISRDQLYKAEDVLAKLKTDISFSQHLMSVVGGHDVFTQFSALKEALSEFSSLLQQYQCDFQRRLASCIKTIRSTGAVGEEENLQDLLDRNDQSPFSSQCRYQWLQNKNAEVKALSQCKSANIRIMSNQNDLQHFVKDCKAYEVWCLIFTSLEGEDPFLSALRQHNEARNIREAFRISDTNNKIISDLYSFILKKTTSESMQATRFIAASVPDLHFPGSAVHLYQSGDLVSRNVKLHVKPDAPGIISVQQTRVTMKLQSLKTQMTRSYRVEYRTVLDDRSSVDMKCRVISCTGENCVVSGLAPGTRYQLRYAVMDSDEMTDYSEVTEFQTASRDSPGALTVLKPTKDSLYIAWQRAESDEDSPVLYYTVEYLEAGLDGWQSIQTNGPVCECKIALPYSTCYRARVSAVYGEGDISTPSETKVPVRVWSIDLSKRKASIFLEVLKLQTTKKCVKLRDCTDEESEVRSFLQCLSYISQLSVDPPQTSRESLHAWRNKMTSFLTNLCLQAVIHHKDSILETLQKLPLHYFKTYHEQSAFLLDLYSRVKDYEIQTGQEVRPALQAVYQKLPEVWSINLSKIKASLFLEVLKLQMVKKAVELRGWSEEESEMRSLLQCLPYISQLSFVPLQPQRECPQDRRKRVREFLLDLCLQAALHQNEQIQTIVEKCFKTDKETSVFLLLLYSHVRNHEAQAGRSILPALQSVYTSLPKIWSINLSDKMASLFLEVLKLQPVKKAVELTGWSEDESEMKILLQCLPYISQLRFGFVLRGKRKQNTTLQFLVKLIAGAAESSAETGENFTELLASLCSFRTFSFSGEDQEFDSVAYCNLLLDLYLHAKDYESETCRSVLPALQSIYESLPEVWTINLTDKKASLFLEVLKLLTVKKVVELTGWSNEKRKVRSFIQCLPCISQLRLGSDILVEMAQTKSLRCRTPVMLDELSLTESSTKQPEGMACELPRSLGFLLKCWKIQRLNLTEYKTADESLIDLLNHQGPLTVRFSEETLQKWAMVLYEVRDEDLTRLFLQNVDGDLSSCSLSWDVIHWFLQHHRVTVDFKRSTIKQENLQDLLSVLDKIHLRGLKSSFVLSIMRKLYETGSAHLVSSLLSSTNNCINLENRQLDSVDCAALSFTLQHCTGVSLNLLWTSVPQGELQSIVPLLRHVSHLRVDRLLLLRLLHCFTVPELQQEAAVLLSALHHKLDFSCHDALDLTADTMTFSLVLSSEYCRVISTAIQISHSLVQLVIQDCEMEEAAVEELFPVLHTVTLQCSKDLLLRFLCRVDLGTEEERFSRARNLSRALREELDLSETQLNLQACKSLALVLEYSEGLLQLDLSHCQITDQLLEPLMPHLRKTRVLDLSHNHITDVAARNIYVLSINSNIQTVCLFNNRITDSSLFLQDKRFEIW